MSTVKINWGTRIAVLYGGFVVLIVVLVAGSMRQSFDLVSPDYYGEEIKYQQVIDAGKNQAALSAPAAITNDINNVTIQFPQEFADKSITGSVQFYSPVYSKWDKEVPLNVLGNKMIVSRSLLQNTRYKIKINWQAGGKNYYQENEITLR